MDGYMGHGCGKTPPPFLKAQPKDCNFAQEIKKLKKENENLHYTLVGVMHFIDKWLDGKELEDDEVNRAITMREKTLKIIENLQDENAKLRDELQKVWGKQW